MADNKVKFLRGSSNEYKSTIKDNDTFYYTTDDEKLYLGDKEITGGGVTVDDALSDTSEHPVQNKVIKAALDEKANLSDIPTSLPANGGDAETVGGKQASDFVTKAGDTLSGDLAMSTNKLWFGTGGISQFYLDDTDGTLRIHNHDGAELANATYSTFNINGNAATANTAGTLAATASNICLRNMSSGTADATTTNCPNGAWYGKHS